MFFNLEVLTSIKRYVNNDREKEGRKTDRANLYFVAEKKKQIVWKDDKRMNDRPERDIRA